MKTDTAVNKNGIGPHEHKPRHWIAVASAEHALRGRGYAPGGFKATAQ
ncbi:hypothetical protein [Hydrogenophaga taeniospiralis]|jgi:hypothetical protein|nr:hypothetical protein [Hydrogenophaga taeniospiralis]